MSGDNEITIQEVPIAELADPCGYVPTGIDIMTMDTDSREDLPNPGKVSPTGTLRVLKEDEDGSVLRAAVRRDMSRISWPWNEEKKQFDNVTYLKPGSYVLVADKFQVASYYFAEDRSLYLMTQVIWGDATPEERRSTMKLMGF